MVSPWFYWEVWPQMFSNDMSKRSEGFAIKAWIKKYLAQLFFRSGKNIVSKIKMTTISFWDRHGDTRVKDWTLMKSPLPIVMMSLGYVVFSKYIGPRMMAKRKAFDLRTTLIVYNIFHVAYNAWIFVDLGLKVNLPQLNLRCEPIDNSSSKQMMDIISLGYWYFILKLLEFGDGIFFVLRKKFNQVSNLHVVHHSVMPISGKTIALIYGKCEKTNQVWLIFNSVARIKISSASAGWTLAVVQCLCTHFYVRLLSFCCARRKRCDSVEEIHHNTTAGPVRRDCCSFVSNLFHWVQFPESLISLYRCARDFVLFRIQTVLRQRIQIEQNPTE